MKKVVSLVLSCMLFSSFAFCEQNKNYEANLRLDPPPMQCDKMKKCPPPPPYERKQLALGYSSANVEVFDTDVKFNQVAVRYWIDDQLGADLALGFSVGDKASILVSAKVIGKFIKYKRLDLYWSGVIDLGNYDVKNVGNGTVIRVGAGVGAELYIIPCLSVLTEVGLRYTYLSNDYNYNAFGVFVDWLPQAGVRFYFK